MERAMIDRLRKSFDELDQAIFTARRTLERKGSIPEEVLGRIRNYEEILDKQRRLATELDVYIAEQDWDEVTRHIQLINGLSGMIRDDAREILAMLRNVEPTQPRELMLS